MAKMRKRRRHTVEFKRQVVERMKACENVGALARKLHLQRKLLYAWKYHLEGRPEPRHANLSTSGEERKDKPLRDEISRLKSALAEKTLENDFFRSALLKIKEARRKSTAGGASASTSTCGPWTSEQGALSVERMCQLARPRAVAREAMVRGERGWEASRLARGDGW